MVQPYGQSHLQDKPRMYHSWEEPPGVQILAGGQLTNCHVVVLYQNETRDKEILLSDRPSVICYRRSNNCEGKCASPELLLSMLLDFLLVYRISTLAIAES
jgi:hypothetical protein